MSFVVLLWPDRKLNGVGGSSFWGQKSGDLIPPKSNLPSKLDGSSTQKGFCLRELE